ncbi:hypothetical protein MNBD_BACTEROID05-1063 [hydrothermal vent metagenome]|uniref:Uncharacterized protein n=1 Tax=hydrothermal vent metagenome TaxID=652676 RepID=A0A3B0TH64_9ZZZZ
MKYIVIILSIFTITMSAIPCDDDVINYSAEITVISQDSHGDRNDTEDLCSPFCTCVCCASVVIQPTFLQETLISENIYSDLSTNYLFSYSSDYLNRIFQPPRV